MKTKINILSNYNYSHALLVEIPLVHEWDFKFWPKSHRGQKRN